MADIKKTPVERLAEKSVIPLCIERYGKGRFFLSGENGNGMAILARVNKALRRRGWPDRARKTVRDEMLSGDYDHLLQVAMELCEDEGASRRYSDSVYDEPYITAEDDPYITPDEE